MATRITEANDKTPRIIKKYQNRKLYDTQDSCYITLDEIAKLIQQGDDVTVIDNRTKNDVTSIILTQILVDQEKSQKSILPLAMLKEIIRSGSGSLFDFIQRYVLIGVQQSDERQQEALRYIERLVSRGELSKTEGKDLSDRFTDEGQPESSELYGRIRAAVEKTIRSSSELGTIEQKLVSLTDRLDRLGA